MNIPDKATGTRIITTKDELDELPAESIVRADDTAVYQKWSLTDLRPWRVMGSNQFHSKRVIVLPALVIFNPEEDK